MDHPVSNLIETDGFVIASATDVGRRRTGNEDSHALWVADDPQVRADRGLLCVVCDGMGGANAGEVASQLSVATVVESVSANRTADPATALRDAVELANQRVHTQASTNPDQRGMGTTCTAMLLRGTEVWIGHVGDSRAYLVRGGRARPLTRDHSLVAELVDKGHLTPEEAKHDPRRNVVTRSVGALEHVEVDAELAFDGSEPGDVFVLCSDGLHGLVTDAEIAQLASESAPSDACAALIDLANERGGPDNITVFVVRRSAGGAGSARVAASPAVAASADAAPARRSPPPIGLLGVVAGALLLIVAVVGLVLFGQLKSRPAIPEPVAATAEPVRPVRESAPVSAPESTLDSRASQPATDATPGVAPTAPRSVPVTVPDPGTRAAATPSPAAAAPAPVSAAAAGKPGTVRLTTRPFQPCTFYIDGEFDVPDVGFLVKSLPPGDHVVRVEGSAGGAVDVPVRVESGGRYSLVAELPFEGALGNIEIALTGMGKAQVLVDGAQYPEDAPCTVRGLTPGAHSIKVRRARGAALEGPGEVVVAAGGTVRAEYRGSVGR
ncbi:MAG: Stp1/IreP family PP2C-type Ser/Thr phosphatase [Candidatus Eisenbacteria bacterium]